MLYRFSVYLEATISTNNNNKQKNSTPKAKYIKLDLHVQTTEMEFYNRTNPHRFKCSGFFLILLKLIFTKQKQSNDGFSITHLFSL